MALVMALVGRLWGYRHGLRARTVDMVIVASGIGVVRILAFATAVLVARFAGAETFGEYSLFATVFVFVSEVPSAFDTVFIRHANSPDAKTTESESVVLLLLAKILFALLLCLMGAVICDFAAQYFLGKAAAAPILFYGIISGATYSISSTLISLYQKRRQFIGMSLLRVIPNLSLATVTASSVAAGLAITVHVMEYIYLAVSIFLASGTLMLLARQLWQRYHAAVKSLPEFYRIGWTLIASNALINLTNRLDIFFLTPFLSFHDLGIYGAAVRYSAIAGIATGTITTILLPKAPLALIDRSRFDKYVLEGIGYAIVQSILVAILILFIDMLVPVIFGDVYRSGKQLAILLLVQVLVVAYGVPFQALLQCGKSVSMVLYLSITRMLLAVLLLKSLVPSYGAMGGAVAMVGVAGMLTVAMAILSLKQLRPAHGSSIP